ncbi:MAG: hypothetical protein BWY82_02092 [Verrucomicrobia bacterium ADurb.Bin474]|nr:MAG: hypothetical protein BWY82_02092 [Verrucomicrobia bacterium ADurb.Bin474]
MVTKFVSMVLVRFSLIVRVAASDCHFQLLGDPFQLSSMANLPETVTPAGFPSRSTITEGWGTELKAPSLIGKWNDAARGLIEV